MQFADYVKLLGVTLDSTLSFDKHVIDVTRSCHCHIRPLHHVRRCAATVDTGYSQSSRLLLSSAVDWTTATVRCMECRK